ncbi:unnamed protein product [Nezara viridula]|uniref:Transposase n=1 Tax=Nezara viridula TaxID=85310 RepID=A0A9P0MQD9_NEZVI|nr:unnamed protein product [Nezara viridula]
MPLSAEDVARGVALIDDGRSIRYAANAIGVPYETLRDAGRRCRETGSYNSWPGSGRPIWDDRFLTLRILRNLHLTVVQATHQLEEVRGVQISERTARRRLNEYGLMAFRPNTAIGLWTNKVLYVLEMSQDSLFDLQTGVKGCGEEEMKDMQPVIFPTWFLNGVLEQKPALDIESREVSEEEARNWCKENGDMPYIETSARDAINVDGAFSTAVDIWLNLEEAMDRCANYGEGTIKLNMFQNKKVLCCRGAV